MEKQNEKKKKRQYNGKQMEAKKTDGRGERKPNSKCKQRGGKRLRGKINEGKIK